MRARPSDAPWMGGQHKVGDDGLVVRGEGLGDGAPMGTAGMWVVNCRRCARAAGRGDDGICTAAGIALWAASDTGGIGTPPCRLALGGVVGA